MDAILIFLIVIIAYFGPLFLVPWAIKSSGSILGGIMKGMGKFTGALNKSGQEWIGKRRARTSWALDKKQREESKNRTAEEKWARGLRAPYGSDAIGRMQERLNIKRIRQGGLINSRLGRRETFSGTIVQDVAQEKEFQEDSAQLDKIARGLGKPGIEAIAEEALGHRIGEQITVIDEHDREHTLINTEGMQRWGLAKKAQFQDQTAVHGFVTTNGADGDRVLRKNAEKDFPTYANLDPDTVFTAGTPLPDAFIPTGPNDKNGLKNLRIGVMNFSTYDGTGHNEFNHRGAVLQGIQAAETVAPQIAQDYANMLIRSADINQEMLQDITAALRMNPDHVASIRASGGAQRAELRGGNWVRVHSASGNPIP